MNQLSKRQLVLWGLSTIAFLLCVIVVGMLAFVVADHRNQVDRLNASPSGKPPTVEQQQTAPDGTTDTPDTLADPQLHRYRYPGEDNTEADVDSMGVHEKIANGILINSMEPGSGTQDRIHSQRYTITDQQRTVYPDNKWLTWDVVFPGTTLGMPAGEDTYGLCTLGFFGFSLDNGAPAGITAGHCMDGADGNLEWKSSQKTVLDPLGQFVSGQTVTRSIDAGFAGTTDYAVFGLEKGVEGDQKIANNYEVTEVMDPKDIKPGMQLCKMGFRTMETCGPVVASNDDFVRVNLYSMVGDSGGPLYLKHDPNAPTGEGTVTAVGILSGSPVVGGKANDALTDFALIKPIVDHTGIDIIARR